MATGPYPNSVAMRAVRVHGSWRNGGYDTRTVGQVAIIKMSDDSEVSCCTQPHGHKSREVLIRCATAKVAELNDAAGIPEEVR